MDELKELADRLLWRPIETAPKDEGVIVFDGVVGEAYCDSADGSWWWANTGPYDFDACRQIFPTCWMPLPKPPFVDVDR